ncbi:SPARC-like [Gigantopelta aegis]|uniref:SPARC-like n=1 Tax=Gigantopelta aegis TaxID=1735272 RepID=UPI001B88D43F|nr:SPARC-like [Gigantopelta aegis]
MKQWWLCLVLASLILVSEARTTEMEEDGTEEEDYPEIEQRPVVTDPCRRKKCYRGEECMVDENRNPVCICVQDCLDEFDKRYWVCSKKNFTYESECHLDRDHCRCRRNLPECSGKQRNGGKIQLDYYGECKELTECPDHEFTEFPGRMKEWLFIVMKQLAARDELGSYIKLLDSAKDDANHTDAIIWKFCDLDVSPQDKEVSRRELQYIVQSLKPLEHCLLPFLETCDKNNNRKITLQEWGNCLGLDKDKVRNKCQEIRAKAKRQN